MLQWYERVMLQWKMEKGLWNDAQIFRFFESPVKRGLRIGIGLVLMLLGLGLFVWQLDDVAALEQSCREPIVVDAVIDVVQYNSGSYDEYVSYTYEGVSYERVFLCYRKSHHAPEDEGDLISVTLDPRDHGALARHMVSMECWNLSLVLMALGLALFGYCLALRKPKIRQWLARQAFCNERELDQPDYPVNLAFMTLLVLMLIGLALWACFPMAIGGSVSLTAGMVFGFGWVLRASIRRYEVQYR